MKISLNFIIIFVFINCILHAKALRIRRNAYKDESMRWPKFVPIHINKAFSSSERKVILEAMKDIQYRSCIRFKRHTGEQGYVDVVKGEGCSADVGYNGHRRQLVLGTGCVSHSTVLHELFHILGFCHEHTRPDRDQYIRIIKGNIKPKNLHNFNKLSSGVFTSLGLPYDYNSILHYHENAFAIDNSQKTIKSISGQRVLGKATGMSKLDLLKLNKLYRCEKRNGKFYRRMK